MFASLRVCRALPAASLLFLLPASAQAAEPLAKDPPGPTLKWSTTTGVTSDYRDRGVSYSDLKPAAQAGFAVEHSSGLYAFADASTVRFGGDRDVEIAAGTGWAASLGAAGELDLSATYVGYAGFAGTDYVEGSVAWRLPLGPVTPFAAVDYVPSQKPVRGAGERLASNLYLHGGAEWEIRGTPLTLHAEIGRERGSFVPDSGTKWDWQVGASASVRGLDLGLAYVDTDSSRFDPDARRLTRRGLVVTASAGF